MQYNIWTPDVRFLRSVTCMFRRPEPAPDRVNLFYIIRQENSTLSSRNSLFFFNHWQSLFVHCQLCPRVLVCCSCLPVHSNTISWFRFVFPFSQSPERPRHALHHRARSPAIPSNTISFPISTSPTKTLDPLVDTSTVCTLKSGDYVWLCLWPWLCTWGLHCIALVCRRYLETIRRACMKEDGDGGVTQ